MGCQIAQHEIYGENVVNETGNSDLNWHGQVNLVLEVTEIDGLRQLAIKGLIIPNTGGDHWLGDARELGVGT
jgi:hypothetical protein